MTERLYGWECKDELKTYLNQKILHNSRNKDNKPLTKREIRLIKTSFIAGFGHRYWKERKRISEEMK